MSPNDYEGKLIVKDNIPGKFIIKINAKFQDTGEITKMMEVIVCDYRWTVHNQKISNFNN